MFTGPLWAGRCEQYGKRRQWGQKLDVWEISQALGIIHVPIQPIYSGGQERKPRSLFWATRKQEQQIGDISEFSTVLKPQSLATFGERNFSRTCQISVCCNVSVKQCRSMSVLWNAICIGLPPAWHYLALRETCTALPVNMLCGLWIWCIPVWMTAGLVNYNHYRSWRKSNKNLDQII